MSTRPEGFLDLDKILLRPILPESADDMEIPPPPSSGGTNRLEIHCPFSFQRKI